MAPSAILDNRFLSGRESDNVSTPWPMPPPRQIHSLPIPNGAPSGPRIAFRRDTDRQLTQGTEVEQRTDMLAESTSVEGITDGVNRAIEGGVIKKSWYCLGQYFYRHSNNEVCLGIMNDFQTGRINKGDAFYRIYQELKKQKIKGDSLKVALDNYDAMLAKYEYENGRARVQDLNSRESLPSATLPIRPRCVSLHGHGGFDTGPQGHRKCMAWIADLRRGKVDQSNAFLNIYTVLAKERFDGDELKAALDTFQHMIFPDNHHHNYTTGNKMWRKGDRCNGVRQLPTS